MNSTFSPQTADARSHFDNVTVSSLATRALLRSRSSSPMHSPRASRQNSRPASPAPQTEITSRRQRPTVIPIHRRSSFNYAHDLAELSPVGQVPPHTSLHEYGGAEHFNREELKHRQHLQYVLAAVEAFKDGGRRRRERDHPSAFRNAESGDSFSET